MFYRIRRGASLLELLITFAIIGGLAALFLTGAWMLLRAAYRILE
jgi:type II secretory pathway pseudopilin PulG